MKLVKSSVLSLSGLALMAAGFSTLSGCSPAAMKTDDPEPDAAGRVTGLGRAVTKAEGVDTNNNISQINMALGMIKNDNDGVAPATIEEAKRAAKLPEDMWIDKSTNKPLVYNPATGTVSR